MAGHSKFKNIMHRKGAQDKKRAKVFTKALREIHVAVKAGGGEIENNPRLRTAIQSARAVNMPKDNVDRAIKKALGDDSGLHYAETRYEGYGPGGVALIVECLTDNKNRSASDIRAIYSKGGGNMGEPGSVSFMFDHLGYIAYPLSVGSEDIVIEKALDAGADNVETSDEEHEIYCQLEDFSHVRDNLELVFGEAQIAKLVWKAQNPHPINDLETAKKLMKLIDTLEDNDDVQVVWDNSEIPGEILEKL